LYYEQTNEGQQVSDTMLEEAHRSSQQPLPPQEEAVAKKTIYQFF